MINLSLFVERLKEYMTEYGLTVTELAKEIKCSRATASSLLNEAHVPSTKTLLALTECFNCSADYLLGLTDYPKLTEFQPAKPFNITLKKFLSESGTTEYRLQQDLDISTSLTYRWLTGKAVPNVNSLIKLRKKYGLSIDYLLGRET